MTDPTGLAEQHHQFDDERRRYPEVGRRRPPRMTRLDKRHNHEPSLLPSFWILSDHTAL
jgi:hypothetical protein